MQLIDGRKLAAQIQSEIAREIKQLGIIPGLAVILVGDNPASHLYVSLKAKSAREVGIHFEKHVFEGTEPQSAILAKIQELNAREDIHGILVQVPLPQGYAEDTVISQIDPKKDADGFHQVNLRAILAGKPRIMPAVALGIVALVDEALKQMGSAALYVPLSGTQGPALHGKKAIIIANRMEFAAPLEYLLEARGAIVHIILRAKEITPDIADQLRAADVLVVARGHANFINGDMLKDGAIVIDAGTNKLPDGRVVGDVEFSARGGSASGGDLFRNKAGFITPVPGGVGPMTVAMLLKNTFKLAQQPQTNK